MAPPGGPGHHAHQGGQRGQLSGQPAKGLSTGHGRGPEPTAQNSCGQTRTHASGEAQSRTTGRAARRDKKPQGGRAWGRRQELHFRVQRVRNGRKWPTSPNLPSAAFPDFQGDIGVMFLTDKLRSHAMDLLRERKTVNVSR